MFCRLKSCQRCGGDLLLDGDEWRCCQCGQRYYPPQPSSETPEGPPASASPDAVGEGRDKSGSRHTGRTVRHVNAMIVAKDHSDERWWTRNEQIIRYLDEGLSAREIASLVGRGERQVRLVRDRLKDLRATGDEWPQAGVKVQQR